MNVVDSSGWLEYFSNGKNSPFFASPIENRAQLIVPTLSIFEVFKRIAHLRGESHALQATALMLQGKIVELDATLAIAAARLSLQERLPLADSIMLATSRACNATLWTQDADFEGRDGVRYIAR
jgi:predicted nucleic acid-binding protein